MIRFFAIPLVRIVLAIILIAALAYVAINYWPVPQIRAAAAQPQQLTPTPAPANPTTAPTNPTPAPANPTQAPPVSGQEPKTDEFALKGLRFPAYAAGQLAPDYDLFVEANGRLWQAWLPIGPERVAHSVAFELPEGNYVFNGVICRLYVDSDRNGKGSANAATVANGNDLRFTVELPANADYMTAYALVECEGGSPSGFDIWYLGQ